MRFICALPYLFYSFLIIVMADSANGDNTTETDPFYPCQSSKSFGEVTVICERVSINTVRSVFTNVKSPHRIGMLLLIPSANDQQIVSNVIGRHSIGQIILNCPNRNKNPLVVHPAAFTRTKSSTTGLDIKNCDLSKLNWEFLKGFSKLKTLNIKYSSNIHLTFSSFPSKTLTSLSDVFWYSIVGIDNFKYGNQFPAPLPQGLTSLWIWFCEELRDDATNLILRKWITPTSQNTLYSLQLNGLNLTQVPSEVSKFKQMADFKIFANINPMTIQAGALNSTKPYDYIHFDESHVNAIQPGAFLGDFKYAFIIMVGNNITTLDRGVFQTMLQQMESRNGYLEVAYNPIDCSSRGICNLAWLIRDNPKLLDAVWSARCSNGTYLFDLNPNNLRGPDGKTCPKTQELIGTGTTAGAGPFAPCQSENTTSGFYVECNRVNVETVKNVFNKVKNPKYIKQLFLSPNISDSKIIANIIGDHTIGKLLINCPGRRTNPLQVDPAAFTQTRLVTHTIEIYNCELKWVDWSFLKGFSNLGSLTIAYSSNLHTTFNTLPTSTLTRLDYIWLNGILGMNGFNSPSVKFPPPLPNGLSSFWVYSAYDMTTAAMQNFLAKWVTPTSTKTLRDLGLISSTFSAIPSDVSKYTQLKDVEFWDNSQPWSLQSGAFNLTNSVLIMYFDTSEITSVSSGAFTGDYQEALVSLFGNELTTLNSGAFKTMLSQMASGTGFLDVGDNPLDCSAKNICNMAWLIRDNPNYLNSAWNARCSNGTYLFQLNPENLRGANGRRCP